MKITDSQKKVVDSLVCERLRSKPQNKDIVQKFCNKRNDGIAKTLRENVLAQSGSPLRNCSLVFAITEFSSSFVIVTILSLHYSKVLGYWLWIVTRFILQPQNLFEFIGNAYRRIG